MAVPVPLSISPGCLFLENGEIGVRSMGFGQNEDDIGTPGLLLRGDTGRGGERTACQH